MDPIQHRDPDDIRDIPHPSPLLLQLVELLLSFAAMTSAAYLIVTATRSLP